MLNYSEKDYTFVVCAYKESPYLEECIESLLKQEIQVNIILVTSTPNMYIEQIVNKYGIPYYINTGKSDIAQDWNYAYKKANTSIVTIAHQDDIYTKEFAKETLKNINESIQPLIAFTNYGEVRDGVKVKKNKLLQLKRIMLSPLKIKKFRNSIFIRRRILSVGNAICCPSVTFVKENLPRVLFSSGFKSHVDWQTWEKISKRKGAFVYCDKLLMYHRIHEDSATTAIIASNDRTKEDLEMYREFWPDWFAKVISVIYKKSECSNRIN
jgi:glycosyltransferase involved in cell wall biosynthesis